MTIRDCSENITEGVEAFERGGDRFRHFLGGAQILPILKGALRFCQLLITGIKKPDIYGVLLKVLCTYM